MKLLIVECDQGWPEHFQRLTQIPGMTLRVHDAPTAEELGRVARSADAAASVSADFLRHGRDQHVGEAILAALKGGK